MEEFVGSLWHGLITRVAERNHPHAAFTLNEISAIASVLFRAFGGNGSLRVAAAGTTRNSASRRWLDRISGNAERIANAALDDETLRLPDSIALFADRQLNRDLYFWLIALAGTMSGSHPFLQQPTTSSSTLGTSWLAINQSATCNALKRYPGLRRRYDRLIDTHIASRIAADKLSADEARAELAVRQALRHPGTVDELPTARRPPEPVPLWLFPSTHSIAHATVQTEESKSIRTPGAKNGHRLQRRQQGERITEGNGRSGILLPFRAESLMTWAEYLRVHRPHDDDAAGTARAAEELEKISITRSSDSTASRVRFDLDLPSAVQDDVPLGPGLLFPEWDWRKAQLRENYVHVQPMRPRQTHACELPQELRRSVLRLRRQFSTLLPHRRQYHGLYDGRDIDLDAAVRYFGERHTGVRQPEPGIYLDTVRAERDLACLIMADLSLSTDAWISNTQRVVDVIRDSLLQLAEALSATGDVYAMYGFSSLKRQLVRLHVLKEFNESYDGNTRGRVQALKPGYYTRMGAALRFATRVLNERGNALRLLILLTDGKPNDIDHYEGRYAIEDTAAAVREARRAGLRPFCVTIDQEAADYLPRIFGAQGHIVVQRPEDLPGRLPKLYAQLTAS